MNFPFSGALHAAILIGLSFAPQSAFSAEKAGEIGRDLIALSSEGAEHDQALQGLRSRERSEVISELNAHLLKTSSQVFALRALSELGDDYRTPQIEKTIASVATKSNSYEIFDALNATLDPKNKSLAKLYADKLKAISRKKKNSPLKTALLAGHSRLDEPLPDSVFVKLVADDDFTVREATVRQFVGTRERLSQSVQAARFRTSLKLQPYQSRLVAMEAFASLPLPELKALSQAFDPSQCKTEKFTETRDACEKIRESLKMAGGA